MIYNSSFLKDRDFDENNISINFKPNCENQKEQINFDVICSYESNKIQTCITLFEDDFQNLDDFKIDSIPYEIDFLEPDLSFTIIDNEEGDIIVYINFDSGLRHSNIATESGISLKLNSTEKEFTSFIQSLKPRQ